jgi:hypothetical protein
MRDYRRYAECWIMPNRSIRVARMSHSSFAMRHNPDARAIPATIKVIANNH